MGQNQNPTEGKYIGWDGVITEESVFTHQQEAYHLTEAEALIVKKGEGFWAAAWPSLALTAVLTGVSPFVKLAVADRKANAASSIGEAAEIRKLQGPQDWEYTMFWVIVVFAVVAAGICCAVGGERRTIVKRIEKHFKDNPPVPQIGTRRQNQSSSERGKSG